MACEVSRLSRNGPLVRREATDKGSSAYERQPLNVQHRKGSHVIAKIADGSNVTRITALFKKVQCCLEEDARKWSNSREKSKVLPLEDGESAVANQGPEAEALETCTGRAPSGTLSGSPDNQTENVTEEVEARRSEKHWKDPEHV